MSMVPHTYAEWVVILEAFKNKTNDEDTLNAMKAGTIEWQSGVAERFINKLTEAFNSRMNTACDRFQKEMSRSNGQESLIVQAILGLRKEMAFLARAIDIPALPENSRQQYVNLIVEQADNMQKSLEDSAKRDRTGKMSSIIRNHKVNSF